MFKVHIFKIFLNPIKKRLENAFSHHLALTNVSISFIMSGTGDAIQQHYKLSCSEQMSWDKVRTGEMALTGISVGLLCHHWYQKLDQLLPGRSAKVLVKKLLADQVLFSPVCITVFILSLSFVRSLKGSHSESHSSRISYLKEEIVEFRNELHIKGFKLYLAEWVIWPPAQLINFLFLPTRFRVLYDNTISLMYDVYASHVVHETSTSNWRTEKRICQKDFFEISSLKEGNEDT